MSDDPNPAAIHKSSGITETERYLEELCEKNFLSFWSYPRPFRDQGGNKELCDLLVIMGEDVIIFSDKHCLLEPNKDLEIDWQRWFRSAVQAEAKQAWGAERWLRQHPGRVFLDPECSRPLPVPIPHPDSARYHLVVTVHGVSSACQAMLGGTGSLILRTDLRGFREHTVPFAIGDLDPERTFVHVLDDTTLDLVMSTLDTTPDFLRSFREKERVCRAHTMFVAGEENLLAQFLTNIDDNGDHALKFDPSLDAILIDESWWEDFVVSDERKAQIEHDRDSYVWDRLIERFAYHALSGTQYQATEPALVTSEIVLRFLAAESRFRRRMLAGALLEAIETTPPDQRRIRLIQSQRQDEPMYVFLLLPWLNDEFEEHNRDFRRAYLERCVFVARMKHPDALDVIGIATTSGIDHDGRSEDALYFDTRSWDEEDDRLARSYQEEAGILINEQMFSKHIQEYPVAGRAGGRQAHSTKHPRNAPCPCGSGQKYKRCHGR